MIEKIHERKQPDDFFEEDADWTVVEYLDMISTYTPDGRVIFAARSDEKYKQFDADMDEPAIDPTGIIVFVYLLHDDEFFCERVPNLDEVYDRLYKALRNPFVGEFMVFEDGVRKDYRVKNAFEEVLHSYEVDRRRLPALLIEWY